MCAEGDTVPSTGDSPPAAGWVGARAGPPRVGLWLIGSPFPGWGVRVVRGGAGRPLPPATAVPPARERSRASEASRGGANAQAVP